MKKWLTLLVLFVLALSVISLSHYLITYESAKLIENGNLSGEEIILIRGLDLPINQQLELVNVLSDNEKVRKTLYNKYTSTNDSKYYRSYSDSSYTINAFSQLAKERKLTNIEFNILIITFKANNAFYLNHTSPENDSQVGTFSSKAPYATSNIFITPQFTSNLPLVYYKGQGWQLYPVTATLWASEYFDKGDYWSGIELLDELSPYMSIEDYKGMKYGVFKVYFQYSNSSIPWASSYSQGMAAGLYGIAYNQTKDEKYLDRSHILMNSFKVPQNEGGFIVPTKFGNWFLEYNFKPNHLILNGHIITMKGIYYYYQVTGDPFALELFKEGTTSVKNVLPYMDSGNWSYYALTGKDLRPAWQASESYHELHIELLNWLYSITKDPIFIKYSQKWENYRNDHTRSGFY